MIANFRNWLIFNFRLQQSKLCEYIRNNHNKKTPVKNTFTPEKQRKTAIKKYPAQPFEKAFIYTTIYKKTLNITKHTDMQTNSSAHQANR
ncbi:hypothetical protein Cpha266_2651 [Chlorobium phaeobacteroides DSM 266]|uniref:Uncharacterized protein n=1 Tax=Chlorobium phaeobacteroides (strain DSM 266 / SMG 266 / 2430) TaxID=290317 RepID=A1BJQ8_CHLPD|nr:hypothetical protein Cpha266_2651 [Chlorobium phaeobacteroides DSM 266]